MMAMPTNLHLQLRVSIVTRELNASDHISASIKSATKLKTTMYLISFKMKLYVIKYA